MLAKILPSSKKHLVCSRENIFLIIFKLVGLLQKNNLAATISHVNELCVLKISHGINYHHRDRGACIKILKLAVKRNLTYILDAYMDRICPIVIVHPTTRLIDSIFFILPTKYSSSRCLSFLSFCFCFG